MVQYRVHSRTKRRLAKLEGKICQDCGENRTKALILRPDDSITCYNCKAKKTFRYYETEERMPHMNTKRRFVFIKNLGMKCFECGHGYIPSLHVVKNRSELRCKNCLKAGIVYKYEAEGMNTTLEEGTL